MQRDYRAWHDEYRNPQSSLAVRLRVVQTRLSELLSTAPAGPVKLLSMCAGQGHDVLGVVPGHQRAADVSGYLVELDPMNVQIARERGASVGMNQLEIVEADAAVSDTYKSLIPADIVLACGVFGNVSDTDVENTVRSISMLCAPGAAVMWTRHRRQPDLNQRIRSWLIDSGFQILSFDALDNSTRSGVGTARLVGQPSNWRAGHRFFTFIH